MSPNVNPRVFVRERQKSMAKSGDYGSKGQGGGKMLHCWFKMEEEAMN